MFLEGLFLVDLRQTGRQTFQKSEKRMIVAQLPLKIGGSQEMYFDVRKSVSEKYRGFEKLHEIKGLINSRQGRFHCCFFRGSYAWCFCANLTECISSIFHFPI